MVEYVHCCCGDTVDWYGADVIHKFVLFFDSVDVRLCVCMLPLMLDEYLVEMLATFGDVVADFVDVAPSAFDFVGVGVVQCVVGVHLDDCCS